MRKAVFTIMLAVPFLLLAEPPTFFSNVTNLWFQGHKSNVLAIAEERLACNSNDVVGAVLKMEYDFEFLNLSSVSNSIMRVEVLLRDLNTTHYLAEDGKFSFNLSGVLDLFTNQCLYSNLAADKAKAFLPGKHMSFERLLHSICLDGLATNYPPSPFPE